MTAIDRCGIMAYLKVMSEFGKHNILEPYQISCNFEDIHTFIYLAAEDLGEIYDMLISGKTIFSKNVIDAIQKRSNNIWYGREQVSEVRNHFPKDSITINYDAYKLACDYLSLQPESYINIDSLSKLAGRMYNRLDNVKPEHISKNIGFI